VQCCRHDRAGDPFSELGLGDYWDDADRWTRNMFAEGQLQTTDWIDRITEADAYNPPPAELLPTESIVGPWCTAESVPARSRGAFAGYPAVNDWYVRYGIGIQHCCTATSALTLYQLWKSIVSADAGRLRVNLLMNHASRWFRRVLAGTIAVRTCADAKTREVRRSAFRQAQHGVLR
jgi:hypothetical protein